MCTAPLARFLPPAAEALHEQFVAAGYRPIGVALVSDLKTIRDTRCIHCHHTEPTVEALPYHKNDHGFRLAVLCHNCASAWEV
jgi:hypothetical protein